MNIYKEALRRVAESSRFRVDLKKKTFRLGKKYIIKNGVIKDGYTNEEAFSIERLEVLYDDFRRSMPSVRSDNKRKRNFVLSKKNEDNDFLDPKSREVSQCALELYILLCVCNNTLTWSKECLGEDFKENFFYWKSKNICSLILFREWIV